MSIPFLFGEPLHFPFFLWPVFGNLWLTILLQGSIQLGVCSDGWGSGEIFVALPFGCVPLSFALFVARRLSAPLRKCVARGIPETRAESG